MPNSDGTGNAADGIGKVFLAAICFAPLVLIGTGENPKWWAMALAGLVGGGLLAKIATKGSLVNILGWASIGAAAGLGFYFAI